MKLKLENIEFSEHGIFGILEDENNFFALNTLQHAYPSNDAFLWKPKLPPGDYVCVRGFHRLPSMVDVFETFEITNVPGHTGILFHVGNFNKDSEGCVLLAYGRKGNDLIESKAGFQAFMDYVDGIDQFDLTVI